MPTFNPAASRTMTVFEVFAREKRELSNSEMARFLSVANSSCLDLLHTLHSLGYLIRTSRTRRFYPTRRLYEAARQINENNPLTTVAQEAVELLAEKSSESAFFGILDSAAVKVVAVQSTKLPLRYTIEVGERAALHATGIGKALLALLPRDEALCLLKRHTLTQVTPHTITNIDRLFADIEQARDRGWYESRSEGAEGVTGLAMSGRLGDEPAAISLAGPSERIEKNRDACLRALQEVRATLFTNN